MNLNFMGNVDNFVTCVILTGIEINVTIILILLISFDVKVLHLVIIGEKHQQRQKIVLKAFHCEILNDIPAIQAEENTYKNIPVIRKIDRVMVERNFLQVKQDVVDIANAEIERMINDPALAYLMI